MFKTIQSGLDWFGRSSWMNAERLLTCQLDHGCHFQRPTKHLEVELPDEDITKANEIIIYDILMERGREEQHGIARGS